MPRDRHSVTRIVRCGIHADAGVGTFRLWIPFPVSRVRILNASVAAAVPEATCLVCSSSLFQNEEFALLTVAVPAVVIAQKVTMNFHTPIIVTGMFDLKIQLFDGTIPDQDCLVSLVMEFS